uniref:Uncharacterized protein n=1 Tax=Coccidioides posadasii RMSCC 3488 TaxID=454284 RepID=A0A0J6F4J2_COCPO|nr:hypothetical protein CPAG_00531 [Coccidioides posadasii RMSCC 3488]
MGYRRICQHARRIHSASAVITSWPSSSSIVAFNQDLIKLEPVDYTRFGKSRPTGPSAMLWAHMGKSFSGLMRTGGSRGLQSLFHVLPGQRSVLGAWGSSGDGSHHTVQIMSCRVGGEMARTLRTLFGRPFEDPANRN